MGEVGGWAILLAMLGALYYFGVLQDRAYRKVGGRRFSLVTMWRVLQTREMFLAALLGLLMIGAVNALIEFGVVKPLELRPVR